MDIDTKKYIYFSSPDGGIFRATKESTPDEVPTFADDNWEPNLVVDVSILDFKYQEWELYDLVVEDYFEGPYMDDKTLLTKKELFVLGL